MLVGQAPGLAGAKAGAGMEEAVRVDASGEPDERVDGCEHERERERVLPERHADECASGRENERRGNTVSTFAARPLELAASAT